VISKEENILLNAEKLFAEKGFDATSTREISAAANVNISMISYYFGSKEQLLEKLFEYRMKESTDFIEEIMEKDDLNEWEKLMMLIKSYIARVQNLKDFYSVLQTEQITNKNPQITEFLKNSKLGFLKAYEELLKKGFEKGIFTKKPKVEFLHTTAFGTVFYAFNSAELYREFEKNKLNENDFKIKFFEDLKQHLKQVLKDLLGYEEK
jgi:AcrR family transcriptional regulator